MKLKNTPTKLALIVILLFTITSANSYVEIVNYYSFDNASLTTDYFGRVNLTNNGATTDANGIIGNQIFCDGTDNFIGTNTHDTNYAIGVWINDTAYNNGAGFSRDAGGASRELAFFTGTPTGSTYSWDNTDNTITADTNYTLTHNNRYFVVFSFDDTTKTATWYQNNNTFSEGTTGNAIKNSGLSFYFCDRQSPAYQSSIYLDEIFYTNQSLNMTEVREIYNDISAGNRNFLNPTAQNFCDTQDPTTTIFCDDAETGVISDNWITTDIGQGFTCPSQDCNYNSTLPYENLKSISKNQINDNILLQNISALGMPTSYNISFKIFLNYTDSQEFLLLTDDITDIYASPISFQIAGTGFSNNTWYDVQILYNGTHYTLIINNSASYVASNQLSMLAFGSSGADRVFIDNYLIQNYTAPIIPTLPTINTFTTTNATILNGTTTQLDWTTTNAIDLDLSGTNVSGLTAYNVSPTTNTTYTLTATNENGSVNANLTISVYNPAFCEKTLTTQRIPNAYTGIGALGVDGNYATLENFSYGNHEFTFTYQNFNSGLINNTGWEQKTIIDTTPIGGTPETKHTNTTLPLACYQNYPASNQIKTRINYTITNPADFNCAIGTPDACNYNITQYCMTYNTSGAETGWTQTAFTTSSTKAGSPNEFYDQTLYTCYDPIPPTITSFTTANNTILNGTSTQLNWIINYTEDLDLSGINVTGLNNYTTIALTSNTTYTLTATNENGSVNANLTINVYNPPTPPATPTGYTAQFDPTDLPSVALDTGIEGARTFKDFIPLFLIGLSVLIIGGIAVTIAIKTRIGNKK